MKLFVEEKTADLLGKVSNFITRQNIEGYIVGGYVRDALLGRPTRDIDIAIPEALEIAKKLAKALDRAIIVSNYNTTPLDPAHPANPSGLRIGTPAITTSGMKEAQAEQIAGFINKVAENIDNESVIEEVAKDVLLLSSQFPVPDHFIIPNKNNMNRIP